MDTTLIEYDFQVSCKFKNYKSIEANIKCNKDQITKYLKEYVPLPGSLTCLLPRYDDFILANIYVRLVPQGALIGTVNRCRRDNNFRVKFNKKFQTLPRTNNKSY